MVVFKLIFQPWFSGTKYTELNGQHQMHTEST